MRTTTEPEIQAARRAWAVSQTLLGGAGREVVASRLDVGWHAGRTDPEAGAFAVVRLGGELEDLVGEVLRVTSAETGSSCFVYVVRRADVVPELSLYRRAFLAIGNLAWETAVCTVEVL